MCRTIRTVLLAAAVAGVLNLPAFAESPPPAEPAGGLPAERQPQTKPADVPVRDVVLFSSGVGYFEHFGTVAGDGSTELRFKTSQINDILKSLILQDLDGGRVSAITYPSLDPVAKTLRSFQVDITANPPLADLLNQLRGARVSVTQFNEKLSGTILGVEKKKRPVGEKKEEVIEVSVLNLISGGRVVAITLDDVSSIELEDPQLQDELARALTALAQSRDQDKKPVQIAFTGKGERRVRLGYVVETPVWKTSYRLILGGPADGDEKAAKPEGVLQGWAIVENQTDNDWNNVQLSLVSGRPISYVMDLYQPLYVPRPVVEMELYASLRPPKYAAGMGGAKEIEEFAERDAESNLALSAQRKGRLLRERLEARFAAPAARGAVALADEERAAAAPIDATASVQSIASAAKVGELFQYTVGSVSLPRQKSAMIPIITDPVEVERLSIYNASVLARNPLNGARLKNTTDKHLLQGPITVLDGNTYAGDAQVDNVPPGQERLLSYGIDLQMLVNSTNAREENALLTGKIVKGVLELQRKHVFTQEYVAENKSGKDRTLIVEHPFRPGWKLTDTEKPIETTDTLYRFKGTVSPDKASKLVVKEETVLGEAIAILPADLGQLAFYARAGEIPPAVREALAEAIRLKQQMVDTQRQIDQRRNEINEITQEQNRIRENMRTVQANSQYYNRLMTKLNDQETALEKRQTEVDELTVSLDQQRKALEGYLSNLKVG